MIDVDETGSQVGRICARHVIPYSTVDTVVPVDIRLGEGQRVLVVTGPNTGGKTVALKTVGLLAMMMQSGMFIPAADGSGMSVFDGIFADIGDEQSIEQSLSTFSSHMTKIIAMLRARGRAKSDADRRDRGRNRSSRRFRPSASDHHGATRSWCPCHRDDALFGAQNVCLCDGRSRKCQRGVRLETLRPTYRLITGVPGRSNALAIAQRLGLPAEIADDAAKLPRSWS